MMKWEDEFDRFLLHAYTIPLVMVDLFCFGERKIG